MNDRLGGQLGNILQPDESISRHTILSRYDAEEIIATLCILSRSNLFLYIF